MSEPQSDSSPAVQEQKGGTRIRRRHTPQLMQIFRARALLVALTSRDLKARYRGSILGYFWSLANPLLMLTVYTIVFTTFFKRPDVQPYALFLFTGILPWTYFSGAVLESTSAISANSALIKKVTFPGEILPLVVVTAHLVHLILALPILFGALVIARLTVGTPIGVSLTALPLIILLLAIFVAGVSLACSAIAVLFRDLRDIVANLLNLGFFLTPILYSLEAEFITPTIARILRINPVTPFVLAFQDIFFFSRFPPTSDWILMSVYALASITVGLIVFDRLRDTLAEAV